ncbi:MAG: hypothetical protein IPJ66_05725 [Bacteroidetes bacterium]|nr:hypothetical protein [Bacteroidota bacterium]MBL0139147.1 hypothetical protein [Bacteroidota bacterium]
MQEVDCPTPPVITVNTPGFFNLWSSPSNTGLLDPNLKSPGQYINITQFNGKGFWKSLQHKASKAVSF